MKPFGLAEHAVKGEFSQGFLTAGIVHPARFESSISFKLLGDFCQGLGFLGRVSCYSQNASVSAVSFTPMDDEQNCHSMICFINLVDHPPITDPIAEIAFQWPLEFSDVPMLIWIFPEVLKTTIQAAN